MAIRKEDLFAAFEVCDCDAFFFAETWRSGKRICLLRLRVCDCDAFCFAEMWRSGKRICLLRLKCVIVMRFSLLKRGDRERGFVCCV